VTDVGLVCVVERYDLTELKEYYYYYYFFLPSVPTDPDNYYYYFTHMQSGDDYSVPDHCDQRISVCTQYLICHTSELHKIFHACCP